MAVVKEISATKSDLRLNHHGLLTAVVYFSAVLIGALLSWDYRYVVDNDTISHLDMADAYFRGDWKMAVHTYWNPLYAWVLDCPSGNIRLSILWCSRSSCLRWAAFSFFWAN